MKYYLGVDGGGTKTKFVLCDEHGMIVSTSIQPTCHYMQCGYDGITDVMKHGLQECLTQATIQVSQIKQAFIACAGYGDIKKDEPYIEAAVHRAFPTFPYIIGNDTENALAGSLAGAAGINIIAGTGSIALGKNETGKLMRCGGWHHFFGGDEGSAHWIACKLILHFTRQSDGREPKTSLYSFLKEFYHFSEDSDILSLSIDTWHCDRTKVASMSKLISELALMQDPIALSILAEAAKELSDMIIAVYRGLSFSSPSVLVSYSGGVFKSDEMILRPLRSYLSALPSYTLVSPILPPDAGSLILAMKQDQLEISEYIIQNLSQTNE